MCPEILNQSNQTVQRNNGSNNPAEEKQDNVVVGVIIEVSQKPLEVKTATSIAFHGLAPEPLCHNKWSISSSTTLLFFKSVSPDSIDRRNLWSWTSAKISSPSIRSMCGLSSGKTSRMFLATKVFISEPYVWPGYKACLCTNSSAHPNRFRRDDKHLIRLGCLDPERGGTSATSPEYTGHAGLRCLCFYV